VSVGKKFLIRPMLPPMSDLTPFYGTAYRVDTRTGTITVTCQKSEPDRNLSKEGTETGNVKNVTVPQHCSRQTCLGRDSNPGRLLRRQAL
jgi:hypothetical protein